MAKDYYIMSKVKLFLQTGTAVLAGPLPEPALPRLIEKVLC